LETAKAPRRALDLLTTALAATLVALPFLMAVDYLYLLRSNVLMEQFLILELGFALALVFWTDPRNARDPPDAISLVLGGLALAGGVWACLRFPQYGYGFAEYRSEPVAVSVLLLTLTMEGIRRYAGLAMTGLIGLFLIYGYFGQFLPSEVASPPITTEEYLKYVVIGGDALIGKALEIIVVIVLAFVVFGAMLEFAGSLEFIKNLALRFTSKGHGAPIKVAIVSSGLIGSVLGSTTSNILATGPFSIPLMRRMGLKAEQAAGVEAVASTGGQLTPPVMGLAAFLIVDIAGISYTSIITAALLPSVLFYFSLFIQADRYAARHGFKAEHEQPAVPARELLLQAIPFGISLSAVVGSLFLYEYAPQWAAAMGALTAFACGLAFRRPVRSALASAARLVIAAGHSCAGLVILGAAVGIMIGVINSTGLAIVFVLSIGISSWDSLLPVLLLAAVAAYVLGMGLPTVPVYVIVGTVIAPSLIEQGLAPIVAHLFVFYIAMLSMITPPVAIACLIASSLAGASFTKTSMFAMKFGWLKYVLPFVFVYSPELLLMGEPAAIAGVLVATATAIVLMANATSGFDKQPIGASVRMIHAVVAAFLLLPVAPVAVRVLVSIPIIVWLNRHRFAVLRRRRAA